MSRTLSFVDYLLERGRHWQRLGFWSKARAAFEHLSRLPELSPNDFQEVQDCLAEIAHEQDDFTSASRHRALTLCLDAEGGRRQFEMGRALLAEDRPDRALTHLRLAARSEPHVAEFHAMHGQTALSQGERDEALQALRTAAELSLDDADVLSLAVQGLLNAGEADEARRIVLQARFRNHRDRRFEALWHDVQFQTAARRQADAEEPVILPMVPSTGTPRRFRLDGQIYRIDAQQTEHRGPTERTSKRRQHRP